jgi:hypothetical protein
MLRVRRDLVWDYDVPEEPERDEAFMALYVGRVLDRGNATPSFGGNRARSQ